MLCLVALQHNVLFASLLIPAFNSQFVSLNWIHIANELEIVCNFNIPSIIFSVVFVGWDFSVVFAVWDLPVAFAGWDQVDNNKYQYWFASQMQTVSCCFPIKVATWIVWNIWIHMAFHYRNASSLVEWFPSLGYTLYLLDIPDCYFSGAWKVDPMRHRPFMHTANRPRKLCEIRRKINRYRSHIQHTRKRINMSQNQFHTLYPPPGTTSQYTLFLSHWPSYGPLFCTVFSPRNTQFRG